MKKECKKCKFYKCYHFLDEDGIWFAEECTKHIPFKYFCTRYINNPKEETEEDERCTDIK